MDLANDVKHCRSWKTPSTIKILSKILSCNKSWKINRNMAWQSRQILTWPMVIASLLGHPSPPRHCRWKLEHLQYLYRSGLMWQNALGTSWKILSWKAIIEPCTHEPYMTTFSSDSWFHDTVSGSERSVYAISSHFIQHLRSRGVVGCMLFVDIDPSAVPDCHRAIPISICRNLTVDRPIYMRGNILSQSTKPSCWDFPRKLTFDELMRN